MMISKPPVSTGPAARPERVSHRAAARVICVDPAGRILLIRWHDTVDDVTFWEPPGGGLEAGETSLQAARRELWEETGLPQSAVTGQNVVVYRRFRWLGTSYERHEPFFVARFAVPRPPVVPARLTTEEHGRLIGHAWFSSEELATFAEPVEPPDLRSILQSLGIH